MFFFFLLWMDRQSNYIIAENSIDCPYNTQLIQAQANKRQRRRKYTQRRKKGEK